MRRSGENKRDALFAQLMHGSGGHRLHTDQAYIVCYFVLDFFFPSVLHNVIIATTILLASILQIHGAQQGAGGQPLAWV